MEYYVYESHLGGYYATDDILDYEDTYCDSCGDSDQLVFSGTEDDLHEQFVKDVVYYRQLIDKYTKEGNTEKVENIQYELEIIEYEYKGMLEAIQERS